MLIFSRINPTGIIASHFRTFYDARSGKVSVVEVVALVASVVAVGVISFLLDLRVPEAFFSSLLNFYAIIGGFLISALFIIITFGDVLDQNRKNLPEHELSRYKKLHEEIFSNTSFGVLIAFTGTALCVLFSLSICSRFLVALSAMCIVVFIHTLMLVLKRLDRLFRASL